MLEAAIIGAGPYGLSIAAHFRRQGLPFRIFGPAMDSWRNHMPKGMMLKSDGFASNIYAPVGGYSLKQFCQDKGITYDDNKIPVGLDTFNAYGLAFRDRLVPELEEKFVTSVERISDSFQVHLDDGEIVAAKRVILAIGITHFAYVPSNLKNLPSELLTHSFGHHDLQPFRGRKVVVIGGGASAIGLAGLLRGADANVELVVRESSLKFHGAPSDKPRSLWQQIRHPKSGLGPGLRSRFCADYPMYFHYLPEKLRVEVVQRHLGPSGHWVSKETVLGRVPLHLGYSVHKAVAKGSNACLCLRARDGSEREILADHVIAGTGFKVDVSSIPFLSPAIQGQVETRDGSPVLSPAFESSVRGLYFVGLASANSFGPVMRFAFGAGFAAERLTKTITKLASRGRAFSPAHYAETI
jgi:cation diffusion facilitator CzcD-associated flavoprotein CzcO